MNFRLAGYAALAVLITSTASAQTFQLKGVRFTDSVYLKEAELQATVKPYMNRPITFADVQEMYGKVQALYTKAGIPSARVLLLPQDVRNGILKLDLVEAKLGDVTYDDLNGTKPEWLAENISLRAAERPDYEQLERDLRIFEVIHDFRPQISFKPGKNYATVDAVVGGTVPGLHSWVGSLDNFGSETTGEIRATIAGRTSNLAGRRDILSYQLQASEGAYSGSLGYSIPYGLPGGRVRANLGITNSNIIQGQFEPISIESDSYDISVGYSFPFKVTPKSAWIAGFSLGGGGSTSKLDGLDFQDTDIFELIGQASYQDKLKNGNFSASIGFKLGNADTVQTSETEGSFQLLFGNAQYSRALKDKAIFEVSTDLQLAPGQNLPVSRLFSAGGPTSVRGYTNNIRSGDSGLTARLQVSPIKAYRGKQNPDFGYTPFGFLDAAVVQPFREEGGLNSDQDYLVSIGAGVRVNYQRNLNMLLMAGVPLQETLGFTDTGKATLYIGLDYKFK